MCRGRARAQCPHFRRGHRSGRAVAGLGRLRHDHQALVAAGWGAAEDPHGEFGCCELARLRPGRYNAGVRGAMTAPSRLWSLPDGALLKTLTGHSNYACPRLPSARMAKLASGAMTTPSGSGRCRMGCCREPHGAFKRSDLDCLQPGRRVAGVGQRDGTIMLWSAVGRRSC